MSHLLSVKKLRTSFFTSEGEVKAVDGLSFDIHPGEALGIVGESGCGKSVTALSIMGLVPPPSGRVLGGNIIFDKRDLLQLDEEEMRLVRGKDIGMIFQDPMISLNPVLSIRRQMTESLELHLNMSAQEAKMRSIELLERVGIPNPKKRIDGYPHQFSGGMRQRVMIAMALSCSPRLLIADEPTTALDVTIQAQIIDLLIQLRRELGTAIMLITHDLGIVAGFCEKVAVMYAGRIVEMAPVDDLYEYPAHPYTRGLLASIPRLDEDRSEQLTPIVGVPPDLMNIPDRCAFFPRCSSLDETCQQPAPGLQPIGPDHWVACWDAF